MRRCLEQCKQDPEIMLMASITESISSKPKPIVDAVPKDDLISSTLRQQNFFRNRERKATLGMIASTGTLEDSPYTFYLENAKKAIDIMIYRQQRDSKLQTLNSLKQSYECLPNPAKSASQINFNRKHKLEIRA
jgi:hypothetical protein